MGDCSPFVCVRGSRGVKGGGQVLPFTWSSKRGNFRGALLPLAFSFAACDKRSDTLRPWLANYNFNGMDHKWCKLTILFFLPLKDDEPSVMALFRQGLLCLVRFNGFSKRPISAVVGKWLTIHQGKFSFQYGGHSGHLVRE